MDSRFVDDAGEAGSVPSCEQKGGVSEVAQEKATEKSYADEDLEHPSQQEYLTRKMDELIDANRRRNEERHAAELAGNGRGESSFVVSAGSGSTGKVQLVDTSRRGGGEGHGEGYLCAWCGPGTSLEWLGLNGMIRRYDHLR